MLNRFSQARQQLAELTRCNYGTLRGWVRHMLAQLELLAGRVDAHIALPAEPVHRLVFVCLGNINRSAFAEWVARWQGARVCSLGLSTTTGAPAFPTAQHTAGYFGLDLGRHLATDFSDYRYQPGDLLLAMEIRHVRQLQARGIPAQAIVLLGAWSRPRRLHLHDPATLSDAYFFSCFTLIHSAVLNLCAELRARSSVSMQP